MSLCRDMMPAWELRAALDASEAEITRLRAENARLRAALQNVMIGGNHLAQVLGIGHLAAGSSYETALEFYGPGPNYDVWCCWNAIMEARAAITGESNE